MKNIRLLFVFLTVSLAASAQVELKKIVPPNPNVASLFKSTITPVNEYSGLPSVSIPLCTVSEGDISLPISMSYNTGGIQVSEEAGIIGLGWALNAGGAITRSVNGVDDFDPTYGYLNHTHQAPDFPIINPDIPPFVNANAACEFPVNGNDTYFQPPTGGALDIDYMPDMFHFNFNGYSGSFLLHPDGTIFLIEREGIDIKLVGTQPNVNFEITTADGMLYEFDLRGETSFPNGNLESYISTWYLTSITDISGNQVQFNYITTDNNGSKLTTEPLLSFNQSFETPTYSGPDASNQSGRKYLNAAGPQTVVDDFYLDEIVFDSGKIQFNYSADAVRLDVKTRYLESLQLVNSNSTVVKTFDFNYSYFGSFFGYNSTNYNSVSLANGDYAQEIAALNQKYPDLNLRLRLDSVTENNIKTHEFEYHGPSVLPNKTTLAQDYWGFYNGAPNVNSFIPELRDSIGAPLNYSQFTPASRIPNETFAKYFSLKKIIYPTKGSTEFDYELNTYSAGGNEAIVFPPTVPQNIPVVADGATLFMQDTIQPNQNATLTLEYFVTLRGWDATQNKPTLTTNDFQNMFYLIFRDLNGNILSKQHIPSSEGQQQWTNFTAADNASMQAVIPFQATEQWNYNNPIAGFNLTEDTYIIEAYFDDMGGLLRGQASLKAKWEDTVAGTGKQFSFGGGLRIKSIVDRDNDGSVATTRNFNYHYFETIDNQLVEKSYGKLKTVPNHNASHRTVYLMKYLFKLSFQSYWGLQGMPKVAGNASSHNSFSKDAGSYVGYDQVETTYEGSAGDNGKIIKYFINEEDLFREALNIPYRDDFYKFPPLRVPHNGVTIKEENYKREGSNYTLLSELINEYKVNDLPGLGFDLYNLYQNPLRLQSAVKENPITLHIEGGASITDCSSLKFQFHHYFSNKVQLTGTTETLYDTSGANPISTVQDFDYENDTHLQRTKTTLTESDGTVIETKVYYPDDIASASSLPEGGILENYTDIELLKKDALHRISIPVQTVTKRDGVVLTIERTEFDAFSGIIQPNKTKIAKGTTSLEDRLLYEDYRLGKPLQMRLEDGPHISYIWGYNNTYPIAKIENASYDEIASALGVTIAALKNFNEGNIAQIEGLRNSNPEFMVSTFTYNPLIGMTSATDPRGYTMSYEYDELNRLKTVKDADNHIVSDYDYHYKGQN